MSKAYEDDLINRALAVLEKRAKYATFQLGSPSDVKNYLRLKMGEYGHEAFSCIWLDNQNRIIEMEEMFRGTLTQASVYPREVTKSALAHNAAAVVFAHNHPSGLSEPSGADHSLTETLKKTLALVDVRVLDHFIVTAETCVSFAEKGWI